MPTRHHLIAIPAVLLMLVGVQQAQAQSRLEDALTDMYTLCLFGEDGPFSQAVRLSQQALAPGLSGFIESNLAGIPLTPPSLEAEFVDGEIVTVVTGFTPIFTESAATTGRGNVLIGTNASYFDLSTIRGQNLNDLAFAFEQDGGGDRILATMPLDLNATIVTLYATYGLTNRLDIGVSLPVVRLDVARGAATFRVVGDASGCRYWSGCQPGAPEGADAVSYTFTESVAFDLSSDSEAAGPNPAALTAVPESEIFLGTVAVRAKYRFPTSLDVGMLAAVLDLRIPTRTRDAFLGQSDFGMRLTLIGEYNRLGSFQPYLNVGLQTWNGDTSNSLRAAMGFSQRLASALFFSFDLLGALDLEPDPFLGPIDNALATNPLAAEFALAGSTIPSVDRDHTLHAALGIQLAPSPRLQIYGSALFSLLDRGLQSSVAPAVGAAFHF